MSLMTMAMPIDSRLYSLALCFKIVLLSGQWIFGNVGNDNDLGAASV